MDELKKFTQVLTRNVGGYLLESTLIFSNEQKYVQTNQIFNRDLVGSYESFNTILDNFCDVVKKQILNDMGF